MIKRKGHKPQSKAWTQNLQQEQGRNSGLLLCSGQVSLSWWPQAGSQNSPNSRFLQGQLPLLVIPGLAAPFLRIQRQEEWEPLVSRAQSWGSGGTLPPAQPQECLLGDLLLWGTGDRTGTQLTHTGPRCWWLLWGWQIALPRVPGTPRLPQTPVQGTWNLPGSFLCSQTPELRDLGFQLLPGAAAQPQKATRGV